VRFDKEDYSEIIELLRFDKKNHHGNINFVLLNDIGNPKLDCQVENELILDAFQFYNN
jgi:3-dehydroquinate synthase